MEKGDDGEGADEVRRCWWMGVGGDFSRRAKVVGPVENGAEGGKWGGGTPGFLESLGNKIGVSMVGGGGGLYTGCPFLRFGQELVGWEGGLLLLLLLCRWVSAESCESLRAGARRRVCLSIWAGALWDCSGTRTIMMRMMMMHHIMRNDFNCRVRMWVRGEFFFFFFL